MQFSTSTFLFLSSLALSSVSASEFRRESYAAVNCEPVPYSGYLSVRDLDYHSSFVGLSIETVKDSFGKDAHYLTTRIDGRRVTQEESVFNFAKCHSSYMGYQAEVPIGANQTSVSYYGHVVPDAPADKPSNKCLTLSTGDPKAKKSLFTLSECSQKDDVSQESNFFVLTAEALYFIGSKNGTALADAYLAVDQATGRVSINPGYAYPKGEYFMNLREIVPN